MTTSKRSAKPEAEAETQERPEAAAKDESGLPEVQRNRGMISYNTREGQVVNIRPEQVNDIDEVAPSGTWDVEQKKREDVQDIPIMVFDVMDLTGQYGAYSIALCSTLAAVESGTSAEHLFTVPISGVPYDKLQRVRGFNAGVKVGNSRLPVKGKLVMVQGAQNAYWDFRSPEWLPEAK